VLQRHYVVAPRFYADDDVVGWWWWWSAFACTSIHHIKLLNKLFKLAMSFRESPEIP
jgi:hypothetical protein